MSAELPRHDAPGAEVSAQQRREALATFQEWAQSGVVIDTETTGLNGSVWEVALTDVPSGETLLEFVCRVPEDEIWSEQAGAMHAARRAEIRAAPTSADFREVLASALNAPGNKPLLAYNAGFDRARLQQTWPDLTLPEIGCVADAYAVLVGNWSGSRGTWKSVTLTEACRREGVDVQHLKFHGARDDTRATALLIHAVAQRAERPERRVDL